MRPAPARESGGPALPLPVEGRCRAVIEGVHPEVDDGRFPIKRCVGESVVVECDAFADGHDAIRCVLLYRPDAEPEWREQAMTPLANDRWRGQFTVDALGVWRYTLEAWVDPFLTWRRDFERRIEPDDIALALETGRALVRRAAERADGEHAATLRSFERALAAGELTERRAAAVDGELAALVERYAERRWVTRYDRVLDVIVDRPRARYGAWYEFFPRSSGPPGRHATLRDAVTRLDYAADMGFDVIYLPPVHPVGRVRRKGPNNTLVAGPEDPGSPWAIGSREGGHKAVHPALGTLDDFRYFHEQVRQRGMELALDIAFQVAPDHPYVKEHPDWFRHRPDGSIQYAENPPKKYEDIYPFDFESEDWRALWLELESVFRFWIDEGVRIFRVDNPHTKPFAFWEWVLASLRATHPDLIVLSEAFTRPKIMHRLAKLGFNQSYTYFAWRNTKAELTSYMEELMLGPGREYMRPNLWPNTPDILTEYLQFGGRTAFLIRVALAATLGASYGIYGPAFELLEDRPRQPGSEEYLDSEKYAVRDWDIERADSLRPFIARLNRIRRENPALQHDWMLRFLSIDNPELLAYARWVPDLTNVIVLVVSLDPHHAQSGWLQLPLEDFGLQPDQSYQMHDLLTDAHYLWHGAHNFVALGPATGPVHVFRLRRRVRTEQDFEYYL